MSELFQRIGVAFKCLFFVLFKGRLPDGIPEKYAAVEQAFSPAPQSETAAAKTGVFRS